jgi:NAD(P)-dependent dehydrogenase (short-subunit alcohol dehydrogenase family)
MPTNTHPLEGRVAIVTGAGRGIGRATALALSARGAAVVVNDLGVTLHGETGEQGLAEQVAREIEATGGRAVANEDSVAEWAGAERIIASALDHFGQLDFLVNNAGLSVSVPISETEPDFFDRVVRSHVYGSFFCLRAALPHMRERRFGRVVNVVSRAALVGVPGMSAYAAGKGGVFGLTNVASRELAADGITVNAVNPAATNTRQVSTAIDQLEKAGEDERLRAAGLRAALQPPEQVAALISALCHDESARFNGQFFYIEKGRVGLFPPIEVEREATTSAPWTVESLLEATGTLEPYSLGAVYGA